jgi:hypothetical protein
MVGVEGVIRVNRWEVTELELEVGKVLLEHG